MTGSKVTYAADGRVIFLDDKGSIQAWDAVTRSVHELLDVDRVYSRFAVSANGNVVAGAARDGKLDVWDLKAGRLLSNRSVTGDVNEIALTSAGRAVSWSDRQGITVLDVTTEQETHFPMIHNRHIISSRGGHLLVQRTIKRMHQFVTEIWDATTDPPRRTRLLEGYGPENCAAFSRDEELLAIGSWNNEIRIYNTTTWEQTRTLKGHTGQVTCVAFSWDRNLLVSGGADNTLKIWNAHTGQLRTTLNGHQGSIKSVAFSPNNDSIASSSQDGTIKIWITASPDEVEENFEARLDAARYFESRGEYDRASDFVAHLIQQDPDNDEARMFQLRLNVVARRWGKAAAEFRELAEQNPDDPSAWLRTAPLYGQAGDLAGYHRFCREMLSRFSSTDQALEAEKVAKACLFVAPEASTLEGAVAVAAKAVALPDCPDSGVRYVTFVRGLADYRTGNYEAARKWSRETLTLSPPEFLRAQALLLLAMSSQQLDEDKDAAKALADAEEVLINQPTQPWWLSQSADLHDWLICQTLHREALELIRGNSF